MAEAMAKALSLSTADRVKMAGANQAFVAKHFGLTQMAAQTMAVYEELINPLASLQKAA
jgi:hypothetical protein